MRSLDGMFPRGRSGRSSRRHRNLAFAWPPARSGVLAGFVFRSPLGSRFSSKSKMKRLGTLLVSIGITTGRLLATGYYGPDYYLNNGGKNVDASPEFYWDLEVKRLARDFHPPEKLRPVLDPPRTEESEESGRTAAWQKSTADADVADFAAAL